MSKSRSAVSRWWNLVLASGWALAACSGTATEPPAPTDTSVPPTAVPLPPTSTPFPAAALRPLIEPLLIQTGDFPDNWEAGKFSTNLPDGDLYTALPKSDLVVDRAVSNLAYGQEGHVTALIYFNSSDKETAYSSLFEGTVADGLGEKGKSVTVGDVGEWHGVAFLRCSALVYIKFYGLFEADVVDFAKRLDGRLIGVVCQ